jgi:hypothetical protein
MAAKALTNADVAPERMPRYGVIQFHGRGVHPRISCAVRLSHSAPRQPGCQHRISAPIKQSCAGMQLILPRVWATGGFSN